MENKKKILVVDDNEDSRKVFTMILKLGEYEVQNAVDGLQAVKKITNEAYDLVLLDVMLPKNRRV